MWLFLLYATGAGLACSCVAMVEVLSSVKYPCVDSDDSMVDAAIVLDYIRAIAGFALTAVVAYGYAKQHKMTSLTLYHSNVSAVMLTILAVLFLGVVQQSEACMNCITDNDSTFTEDLRRMLGESGCADRLNMANFNIPDNYCRDQLQTLCTPTALGLVYAERCLVYACSTRVHGVGFRYVLGLIGMTVQLLVCVVILTDRNTLFVKHIDPKEVQLLENRKNTLEIELGKLIEDVGNIPVPKNTALTANTANENFNTLRFPRPARPGLRLRPNVSTYSRLRQLDF